MDYGRVWTSTVIGYLRGDFDNGLKRAKELETGNHVVPRIEIIIFVVVLIVVPIRRLHILSQERERMIRLVVRDSRGKFDIKGVK